MKHNEQEIKAMVKKAYSAATPDVLESVLSDCKKLKGRVTPMKKKNYLKSIIAAAAAVVFVLAGVIGFGTYQKANKVVSTVALDVNPGIEITINAKEKVLDVKAMNDDAKKVIGDMNFKGSDLDVAVNALIGSMLRCGYLSEITNSILVSVDSSDAAQGEALQKRIAAEIEAILNQNGGGSCVGKDSAHGADDDHNGGNQRAFAPGKPCDNASDSTCHSCLKQCTADDEHGDKENDIGINEPCKGSLDIQHACHDEAATDNHGGKSQRKLLGYEHEDRKEKKQQGNGGWIHTATPLFI